MNTTANTIALLAALGQLDYKPLSADDYHAFNDAGPDAQIAFAGGKASEAVAAILCEPVELEEAQGLAVVVDGLHLEIVGITPDGEPFSVSLDLDRLV